MMTEEPGGDSGSGDGLIFHEGSRLTDLKIKQSLSIDYPRLEPLHHLKIELMFHFFKIKSTWKMAQWSTLAIGFLAVIVSGWDFGIGELSSGGDFNSVGINFQNGDSGIREVSNAAIVLSFATLALWAVFLVRLWSMFPLMRSQSISLFLAFFAAELSQYWAHGLDSKFPFGGKADAIVIAAVAIILIIFICFILQRAVTETRDVHVEERHWHPDPRQVEIAKRDHSLIAWSFALITYFSLVIFHAWTGAHYVTIIEPGQVSGWWILKILYLLSGLLIVWLMVHILWYPQIMLGSAEIRIESDRSRAVGLTLRKDVEENPNQQPARSGKCPDCGEITPVKMLPNGVVEAACAIEGCNGSESPGKKCNVCGTRISSRVVCNACNTSAPIGNHFADEEAW
jgi:hypothetical protein